MLENNNKKIISKLARNTLKANKTQFGILFLAIAISSFMLLSIFTIGFSYLNLSRLQNTRLFGSEYDIALMNGFTEEQKNNVVKNKIVQSVGVETYAGYIVSTEYDQTVDTGLIWHDEIFLKQSKPAMTNIKGHYPKQKNELMVTREALKNCGKENLDIGDRFSMTYEDQTGVHTDDFTISGIWDGFGDKSAILVSKAFYDDTGYRLEYDGCLTIKLNRNYVSNNEIQKIKESLNLTERQSFQPSGYIEGSLKILLGICGLGMIISISAYLLIYNILHLSVSGNIRYYGLLQTLGMTKKQLMQFIKKQMICISFIGIIFGVMLGMITTFGVVPYIMKNFGISSENVEIQFSMFILVLSIVITSISIYSGIRTPMRIATGVTPVEAVKYQVKQSSYQGHKKRKKRNLYWEMANEQLKKDKKKSMVIFISLSTSLIVFYCLTTIIISQGERTVIPNYLDADFIIRNDTAISEDIHSMQQAIHKDFISEVESINGIKEIHMMEGLPIVLPYTHFTSLWIKNYAESRPYLSYSEIIPDYKREPEKYYGMLKGIDKTEFDNINETLDNAINEKEFLDGEVAIIQYPGFKVPSIRTNNKIPFSIGGKTYEIKLGAVSHESYYGASRNIGANLIVSKQYLATLIQKPYVISLNMKYDESYNKDVEHSLRSLLAKSPYENDLFYASKYDDMKTIQDSQGNMLEIGTFISLLLLLVGMLNYINTMANSIQNRKLTFAVMESVGMSRTQIMNLFIREGLLYALGSILITLTIGTGITYVAFQAMNYTGIPFTIPIVPLLCALVFIMIICVIMPLVSYRRLYRSGSIVERLREYA